MIGEAGTGGDGVGGETPQGGRDGAVDGTAAPGGTDGRDPGSGEASGRRQRGTSIAVLRSSRAISVVSFTGSDDGGTDGADDGGTDGGGGGIVITDLNQGDNVDTPGGETGLGDAAFNFTLGQQGQHGGQGPVGPQGQTAVKAPLARKARTAVGAIS